MPTYNGGVTANLPPHDYTVPVRIEGRNWWDAARKAITQAASQMESEPEDLSISLIECQGERDEQQRLSADAGAHHDGTDAGSYGASAEGAAEGGRLELSS